MSWLSSTNYFPRELDYPLFCTAKSHTKLHFPNQETLCCGNAADPQTEVWLYSVPQDAIAGIALWLHCHLPFSLMLHRQQLVTDLHSKRNRGRSPRSLIRDSPSEIEFSPSGGCAYGLLRVFISLHQVAWYPAHPLETTWDFKIFQVKSDQVRSSLCHEIFIFNMFQSYFQSYSNHIHPNDQILRLSSKILGVDQFWFWGPVASTEFFCLGRTPGAPRSTGLAKLSKSDGFNGSWY